jgi:hypothetical protein
MMCEFYSAAAWTVVLNILCMQTYNTWQLQFYEQKKLIQLSTITKPTFVNVKTYSEWPMQRITYSANIVTPPVTLPVHTVDGSGTKSLLVFIFDK